MKKLFLLFTAVILSAFVMSSCIDNEASAGIEAVRNAQAALIQAKAQFTQAQAELEEAHAAYRLAEARVKDAEAEAKEIENDSALVDLQIKQAEALATLKTAEKTLAEAVHALEKYLAEQGLADAATYLADYNDAVQEVRDTDATIADVNYNLSILELYLEAWEDYVSDEIGGAEAVGKTIERLKIEMAAALVDAEDDLADAEDELATILEVIADPTTYANQLAGLNAEIDAIEDAIAEAAIDRVPLQHDVDHAQEVYDDAASEAFDANDLVEGLQDDTAAYNEAVLEYEADVAAAEEAVVDAEADLADAYADTVSTLADANDNNADEIEQLAPFVAALEANWTAIEAGGDGPVALEIEELKQRLQVAVNQYKVEIALSVGLDDDSDGLGDAQDELDAIIDEVDALTDNVDLYIGEGSGEYPSDEHDYNLQAGEPGVDDPSDGAWSGTEIEESDPDEIQSEVLNMMANPDPDSDLGVEQAGGLYDAITPFFEGGEAYDLMRDIGEVYITSDDSYAAFFAAFNAAEGVYADIVIKNDEDGNWSDVSPYYYMAYEGIPTDYDDYLDSFDAVEDALDAVEAAEDAVEDVEPVDEELEEDNADALAALPDAVAAAAAADTAESDAEDALDAAQDLVDDFDAALEDQQHEADDLQALVDAIEEYIDGDGEIDVDWYEAQVEEAKVALEIAQFNQIEVDFNEAKCTEMIASEEAYLAALQARKAAEEAQVARLLELFNDAIGG
jgi:chromosome segregation ATPase